MRTVALLALFAVSSCRANVPDARFSCDEDVDCPPGQTCGGDGLCRAGDAGVGLDAPGLDAPGLDAPGVDAPGLDAPPIDAPRDGGRDAPIDAGPSLRLRVVNAIGDDGGFGIDHVTVDYFGATTDIDFGCVATLTAYRGPQTFQVTAGTRTAGVDVVLPAADSILVLGRDASGALTGVVTPDVMPPSGAGTVGLRYLHLMSIRVATAHHILVDPNDFENVDPILFGQWSAPIQLSDAEPAAVGMIYYETAIIPRLVTTFTMASPTTALVVLTGDADRHPGSPGGPRAIVIPPPTGACAPPILPDPIVVAANLPHDRAFGASRVFYCQIGTPIAEVVLGGGEISGPGAVFAGHSTFVLGNASGTCAGTGRTVNLATDFGAVTVEPGGRYVLALTGVVAGVAPSLWDLTLLAEPPAAEPSSAGSITRSGVVYAHLARDVVPVEVDFIETTTDTVVADTVGPRSFPTGLILPAQVGTTGYLIERDVGGALIGTWPSTGAPTSVGGIFVVLDELDPIGSSPPARRLDLILSPYGGRPWELRGRD